MAAAVANNQSKPVLAIIVGAVAAMGGGVFVLISSGSDAPPQQVAVAPQPPAPPMPPDPTERVIEATSAPAGSPASEPTSAPSIERNRMAREVKREQIWSALGREHELEPAAPGSAAPTQTTAAALPPLDPQYIRTAITEQLLPVATECYESALADNPTLAGTLVTDFTIVGAEDVGGIVEVASVRAEESTLDSEFVRECVRESLMAVTFEPPPDGGRVEITNAFEFGPDE